MLTTVNEGSYVKTDVPGIHENKANWQGRDCFLRLRGGRLCCARRNDRDWRGGDEVTAPGTRLETCRAKQSQFAEGQMNANCCLDRDLREKHADHASEETKPIILAGSQGARQGRGEAVERA